MGGALDLGQVASLNLEPAVGGELPVFWGQTGSLVREDSRQGGASGGLQVELCLEVKALLIFLYKSSSLLWEERLDREQAHHPAHLVQETHLKYSSCLIFLPKTRDLNTTLNIPCVFLRTCSGVMKAVD